jgi:hypothetical protein
VQEELEPPDVEDFGASCVEEDLGASSGARAEEDAGMMNGVGDMCLGAGVEEDVGAVGASIGTENIIGAIFDRVPMICGRGKASSTAVEVGAWEQTPMQPRCLTMGQAEKERPPTVERTHTLRPPGLIQRRLEREQNPRTEHLVPAQPNPK